MGTLPVEGKEKEEVKRTNEIKTAIPLLEAIEIEGQDVTADALLTQRELAAYLVEKRKAHYYFTVKGNQPGLLEALEFYFRIGADRILSSIPLQTTDASKRAKSGRPRN